MNLKSPANMEIIVNCDSNKNNISLATDKTRMVLSNNFNNENDNKTYDTFISSNIGCSCNDTATTASPFSSTTLGNPCICNDDICLINEEEDDNDDHAQSQSTSSIVYSQVSYLLWYLRESVYSLSSTTAVASIGYLLMNDGKSDQNLQGGVDITSQNNHYFHSRGGGGGGGDEDQDGNDNDNDSDCSSGNARSIIQMIPQSVNYNDDDMANDMTSILQEKPSNELLLYIAFVSFLFFTIFEFFAAVYAESQSMMGDSLAMLVDAITYAFNLCAERRKARATRKERLLLELVPPLISVTALILLTFMVMKKAIITLYHGKPKNIADEPDVNIMFLFSVFNMLIDVINVGCFARASHGFGYHTTQLDLTNTSPASTSAMINTSMVEELRTLGDNMDDAYNTHVNANCAAGELELKARIITDTPTENRGLSSFHHLNLINDRGDDDESYISFSSVIDAEDDDISPENGDYYDDDENDFNGKNNRTANLNMCSAYTHVFADTLRSVAVIVAASIAELVESVDGEEADSTAAIVVSCIILLSAIPLLRGIFYTLSELRALKAEEAKEAANKANQQRLRFENMLH